MHLRTCAPATRAPVSCSLSHSVATSRSSAASTSLRMLRAMKYGSLPSKPGVGPRTQFTGGGCGNGEGSRAKSGRLLRPAANNCASTVWPTGVRRQPGMAAGVHGNPRHPPNPPARPWEYPQAPPSVVAPPMACQSTTARGTCTNGMHTGDRLARMAVLAKAKASNAGLQACIPHPACCRYAQQDAAPACCDPTSLTQTANCWL